MSITPDELKILCDTTVKLVAVRQQNCPHVSVENIAPEIMGSLLAVLLRANTPVGDEQGGLRVIPQAELITRQAKKLEELSDEVADLKERARRARGHIYCIGGPLNDNKLGYSKPQMVTFARIAAELGE